MIAEVENAADLPDAAGAYVLVVDLPAPLSVSLPGRAPADLAGGRYLYAGSARGPGGIRARAGRHLKPGKTVRWHIDRLTNAAGVARVVALPGGAECAVVDHYRADPDVMVPAPGFGSSDCRHCPSHLLKLPDSLDPADDAERLARAAGADEAVIWRCPPAACFWRPPPTPPGA